MTATKQAKPIIGKTVGKETGIGLQIAIALTEDDLRHLQRNIHPDGRVIISVKQRNSSKEWYAEINHWRYQEMEDYRAHSMRAKERG
jgi:hypothetical protein